MRNGFAFFLGFASIITMLGIVGGIDAGEPITNVLWLIPLAVCVAVAYLISEK